MKTRISASAVKIALAALGTLALVGSRSVAVEAAYPVERVKESFLRRVVSRLAGAWKGSAAEAENVGLRQEVAALKMLRTDNEQLETENSRLRKTLNYRQRIGGKWLAAGILSSGGGAAASHATLRVDKGSLDGVSEGAAVAVPDGLVGRVTSVTPHTAQVTLLTDGSVKVACEVVTEGANRPRGILSGGDDLLSLRYLTRATDIPPQSRVLTSGLGGVFPKGLVVGTFRGVRSDASGLASEGEVLPAVDYSTLEDVFIRRAH